VLPAGSDPVLVLRARSRTGTIPVALTTVNAELYDQVECELDPEESVGRTGFRVDLGSLRGTRTQLGIVVAGEGNLTRLAVIPRRFKPLWASGSIRVYEIPGALPRAFGVHRVRIEAEDDAQLEAVIDPSFSAHDCVVVPRLPTGVTLPDSPPATPPEITWRHESPSGSHVELDVRFAADGLLVLHDNLVPGWSARLDGRPVEILRANYCFRAVPIPAGAHRVAFTYSPKSLWIGLWLAVAAVVAFGLLAWRGRGLFCPIPPDR
jgi:hypothetical protein